MRRWLFLCLAGWMGAVAAADPNPELPPPEVVNRVLLGLPDVGAADSLVRAEEANRRRLEAGSHEWTARLGSQRRRVSPPLGSEERYQEYQVAVERPLRLPGKGALDAELGAQGVSVARSARGDALHEAGRALLKSWFAWLREMETVGQWNSQAEILGQAARAVQRRQQLGDAARLDTVLAEAAEAQAQAQLGQARTREKVSREELARRFPWLPLPAKVNLSAPQPIAGDEAGWIAAIIEHSHELAVARGEARRASLTASRSRQEQMPDPTIGLHVARERSGEENIVGFSLAIPLPGQARRAGADAALAQADAASSREAAMLQKITAEAVSLYQSATAARGGWESSRKAAEGLARAAEMTARAYQLGEGTLSDLLNARRLANEAGLAARLAQLEALELRYRLLLDTHRLWEFEGEEGHGRGE